MTAETRYCQECGQPDAAEIAAWLLCVSCYQVRGSCCAESGGDDHCGSAAESSRTVAD